MHNAAHNAITIRLPEISTTLPVLSLIDFFKIPSCSNLNSNYLPVSFPNTWMTNASRRETQGQDCPNPTLLLPSFT
jgi:hypothetical protein